MILAKKVRLIPTPEQEKCLETMLALQDSLITIVKE